MPHIVGIIGLGIMGSRMLESIMQHPEFDVRYAWDLSASQSESTRSRHPDIQITQSAQELVAHTDLDLVYIATPPSTHLGYAGVAIDHGKAVYCEKPLAVDVEASRSLVAKAKSRRLPNVVNFGFATGPAVATIKNAIDDGELGELVEIDMQFHFPKWPQAGSWLTGREEGGFVREVFSHFAYLTYRLVGPPTVQSSTVTYPDEPGLSETHAVASMQSVGLPVSMAGRVGGAAPDRVEWTLYGTKRSYRVINWSELQVATEQRWDDVSLERYEGPSQLDAVSNMLKGEAHEFPDFEVGLRVQEIVESIVGN